MTPSFESSIEYISCLRFSEIEERTQKATKEVEITINILKQESHNIEETSVSMTEIAQESERLTTNFEKTLLVFAQDGEHMAQSINMVLNKTFTGLVKLDHLMFKTGAYDAFLHDRKDVHFSNHHDCRLGKWYESGIGKERFSHLPSYREMLTPHQKVHESIIEAVECINQDSCEDSSKIIDSFKLAETASSKLFVLLDSLSS